MIRFDKTKSLQELEGTDWDEPNFDSHLVMECHRLRRVPLKDFTVEDLRIMIGQNIGLDYLVPLAAALLEHNPLAEGDFFPGDLLVSVLRVDPKFWIQKSKLRAHLSRIAEQAFADLRSTKQIQQETETALKEAYNIFDRADYFAKHGRA